MDFGQRIKKLRNDTEMTQNQLADRLEVSRSTIAMIENSERQPSTELLVKLADIFNVTTDYLLGRAENKKGIIVNDDIDGNSIEIEVDKTKYPEGLTHEEVLSILDKLKELGVDWEKFKKK